MIRNGCGARVEWVHLSFVVVALVSPCIPPPSIPRSTFSSTFFFCMSYLLSTWLCVECCIVFFFVKVFIFFRYRFCLIFFCCWAGGFGRGMHQAEFQRLTEEKASLLTKRAQARKAAAEARAAAKVTEGRLELAAFEYYVSW